MRERNEGRRSDERFGERRPNGYRFQAEGQAPFESWEDDDEYGPRDEYAAGRRRYAGDEGSHSRRHGERDYGQGDWERGQHPFGYGPPNQGAGYYPSGWGRGGRSRQQTAHGERERFGPENQGPRGGEYRGTARGDEYGMRPYGYSPRGGYDRGGYDQGAYGGEFSGGTPRGFGGYDGDTRRGERGGARESFRGRGPQSYTRSDDRIREQICDLLTDDDMIDATNIEVQVSQGEITLSGTVHDRESKRCAEDLAESVSGVRNVQNQLRVQSQSATSSGGASGSASARGSEQQGKR